ncbi:unnamed protein product, partial [Prorocentrum cordatum]
RREAEADGRRRGGREGRRGEKGGGPATPGRPSLLSAASLAEKGRRDWMEQRDDGKARCVTVHGTLRNESLQASAHTAPLLGIGHCIPGAVARPAAAFALVTLAELFLLAFVLWSNPRRAWRSSSSSHAFRVASPTP